MWWLEGAGPCRLRCMTTNLQLLVIASIWKIWSCWGKYFTRCRHLALKIKNNLSSLSLFLPHFPLSLCLLFILWDVISQLFITSYQLPTTNKYSAMIDSNTSGNISPNEVYLLYVALVIVLHESNRKVSNLLANLNFSYEVHRDTEVKHSNLYFK